jgi:dTDP-4-dehydrorhamnose reductase
MTKKLLVTGGAGYLGAELVRRAAAGGWEVRATWLERDHPLDVPVEWVRMDVRDPAAVKAAVEGVDCVVHTAYRFSGPECWSTNVEGSELVARAATGARLLHLSTDLVFDGVRGNYREDDEPRPVNDYGRSKAEAERRVTAAHPRALIVRTSLMYGAADPGPQERLVASGHERFFVDEIRSPVLVGDLADALLELAERDEQGPIHLGGADAVSRYDFALLLGADRARIRAARTTPDRAPNVSLDSSRAARLLRARLRGVREVLGG